MGGEALEKPSGLKTNDMANPDNVGDIMPRFSWSARNQEAYEIELWDKQGERPSRKRVLWKPGRIASTRTYCFYEPC